MLVLQPRSFLFWTAFTTRIARSWPGPVLKFLQTTTVGKVGPDEIDDEIRRITRYEEWSNVVEDSESEDDEAVSHGRNNEARGTIIVRPPLRAAEGRSVRI
jgi:hypothetical protein